MSPAPAPETGALLATAMQHALGSLMITDLTGTIVYVNAALERVTGYTAAELLGQRPSILSSGLHPKGFYREMWRTLASGRPWHGEIVNRRKSGELYESELSIAPVPDARGRTTHYLATHRDVSQEKRVRRQLTDRVRELDLMNTELDEFVARVSHDLKEPIAALEAACVRIPTVPAGERLRRLQDLRGMARHLKRRIHGLARLARAGKDRRPFAPIALDAALREAQRDFAIAIRRKRAVVDIGPLPAVLGNRVLVQELFASLLENALERAGDPPRVRVEAVTGPDIPPGFVQVRVTDNGAPIAPRDRERVFLPFFRAPDAASEDAGVGLALARKVAQRHGGRMWTEPGPDGGQSFCVSLPVASSLRGRHGDATAGRFHPPPVAVQRDPGMRVLLVEGYPVAAETIASAIGAGHDRGPQLTTVPTAAEALARAAAGDYDIALVTADLPDGDGLGLVARLKRDHPALTVIVLAHSGDERLAVQAMQCGASDYLSLEEVPASLGRAVDAAAERRRAQAEIDQLKSDMVGIVTHDLKNPAINVLGFADLLLESEEKLNERQHRLVTRMKDNALFMLELISDILDATRIETGKLRLVPSQQEAARLVADAIERNQFLADDKGIRLVADVPEGLGLVVDRGKFLQVLTNLISNGVKYSASGTTVQVSARRIDGTIEIAVADHGQGIPEDEVDKLFKKFSRTSTRATRGEKSTGLGLFIVSEMVKLHRGTIRVETHPGQGSTFTVAIPAV